VIVINGPSYITISFNQLYNSSNVSIIFYELYLLNTNKNGTVNLIHSPFLCLCLHWCVKMLKAGFCQHFVLLKL